MYGATRHKSGTGETKLIVLVIYFFFALEVFILLCQIDKQVKA